MRGGLLSASFLAGLLLGGTPAASRAEGVACAPIGVAEVDAVDEAFLGELYTVQRMTPGPLRDRGGRRLLADYAYRFAVLRRFQGKVSQTIWITLQLRGYPTVKEGDRYLVLARRGEDGRLQGDACGIAPAEEVGALLEPLKPRGEDLDHLIDPVRAIGWHIPLGSHYHRELRLKWKQRVRAEIGEERRAVERAIEAGDPETAYEAWSLRRAVERNLYPESRRHPRSTYRDPLDEQVLAFLLGEAKRARHAHAHRSARRLWRRALQIDEMNQEAREGLEAFDALANRLFQAAYARRSDDPLLARAGLRQVLRLTAPATDLHLRARRLLEELAPR